MKKWINPGFLNGPYLPMYGVGTVLLYGACFIPLPRWALALILTAALTLLEYVTGLIFIKGMKIKLWDYSGQWGNVQGIICPLFSLLWGCIAAGFVYLLFDPLHTAAVWAGSTPMAGASRAAKSSESSCRREMRSSAMNVPPSGLGL